MVYVDRRLVMGYGRTPPIAALIHAIRAGQVDLNDPRVTVQLLKLNAVVGVLGKVVGANNQLATVEVTCALCHSTVDDSVAPVSASVWTDGRIGH
jgi:hypothetical protein